MEGTPDYLVFGSNQPPYYQRQCRKLPLHTVWRCCQELRCMSAQRSTENTIKERAPSVEGKDAFCFGYCA